MSIRRPSVVAAFGIVSVAMAVTYTLDALDPEKLWHWPWRVFLLPILLAIHVLYLGLRDGRESAPSPYDPLLIFLFAFVSWYLVIEAGHRLWKWWGGRQTRTS